MVEYSKSHSSLFSHRSSGTISPAKQKQFAEFQRKGREARTGRGVEREQHARERDIVRYSEGKIKEKEGI